MYSSKNQVDASHTTRVQYKKKLKQQSQYESLYNILTINIELFSYLVFMRTHNNSK